MDPGLCALSGFIDAFHAQKALADRAIAQLDDDALARPLDANTNSVRVIMKHVAGNLLSRFTEFLTTDGEKPWRDRDAEFIDTFASRDEALAHWEAGWTCLFQTLEALEPAQLAWSVSIRGEGYSAAGALARALAHTGYHVGQIVLTARHLAGDRWTTLTIPRGGSRAFNQSVGFDPAPHAPHSPGPGA
jgi:uncharacterized damage-inducible protein DinB